MFLGVPILQYIKVIGHYFEKLILWISPVSTGLQTCPKRGGNFFVGL